MNLGDRRDVSQYFPLSGNGTEAQLPQVGNLAGGPTQRGVRSVGLPLSAAYVLMMAILGPLLARLTN